MSNIQLSYSSLKTLQLCEEKYFHYKIANTPKDPDYEDSDSLDFGKAFHFVLESTNHKSFSEELLQQAVAEFNCPEMYTLLKAMVHQYLKFHLKSGLRVVKCEMPIEHPIFRGFIDFFAVDDFNGWWIGDLKTSAMWFDSILARLPKDMQLNLYSHFADRIQPHIPELNGREFRGCRYRVITKPKLKMNARESADAYFNRLCESVKVKDVIVPIESMNPEAAWKILEENFERVKQLDMGEAPKKNFSGCMDYNRPCPYFSKCHGGTFTEILSTVRVLTIEDTEASDLL